MRVLMLGWEFPPHNSGGLGVACQGLAEAIAGEQVEVIFVLPKKIDVDSDALRMVFANIESMKIRQVDTTLTPYVTSNEYMMHRRMLRSDIYGVDLFQEVARYAKAIEAIAMEEEFDIIHAHDWLSFLAGVAAKEVSGKPLILHVHITSYDQSGRTGVDGRVYDIEKKGMEAADGIIAISEFTKNTILEHYGINSEKIHVVYNGINPEPYTRVNNRIGLNFRPTPETKMVLFVGRLTIQKGPDYFLQAARRVVDLHDDVVFVVAGSGDMEAQVINQAVHLGIADKVFFTGFVRGEELNELYRQADLFVLPSVSEPFGLTPLESLINETPVLVSKQSGVSEILTNALKVDFWDTEEMANKIISTLWYPPMANQLSSYGKNEALGITWQKAAKKCVSLYHHIMSIFNHKK